MSKFAEILQDLIVKKLGQLYQSATELGPKVTLAIIIFLVGWICAVLLKKIISKLLKALGLDVVSEKTGLKHFLEKGGVGKSLHLLSACCFIGSLFSAPWLWHLIPWDLIPLRS